MDMNINIKFNQQFMFVVLLLAIIICIYLYNEGKLDFIIRLFNNINEGFSNVTTSTEIYQIAQLGNYEDTIFERALKNTFSENKLVCNILPTLKSQSCINDENGLELRKDLFPVHIIMINSNKYLAVFNDGKIYTKTQLIGDKFWKGPIKNSLPNDIIPLRMISLDAHKKIIGVGYDNKIYRKQLNYDEDPNFVSRWIQVPNTNDIIYILYESGLKSNTDSISSNDNLLAINKDGMIQKIAYDSLGSESFEVLANDLFPVIKIYYDKNGYLMGIGEDFRLYRKSSKTYEDSVFDPSKKTDTKILDVIYDVDGKLFGLAFLERIGKVELMKQNMGYFASRFLPLELTAYGVEKDNKIRSDDIVKFKTGFNKTRDIDTLNYDSLREIKNNLELERINELRNLCKNRGYFGDIPYHNLEFINRLQGQKEKINELNKVIKNLINNDPESGKIQESIHLLDNPNTEVITNVEGL